jgi:succinylarginine dihydrolase
MAGVGAFGDEGAANHTRLCESYGQRGLEFFVYGKMGLINGVEPKIYPARQSFEASSSIARNHKIKEEAVVYAQQNPDAIDAGVFHNDVAGVGNKNVYFCHERAYLNPEIVEVELKGKFEKICGGNLRVIVVPDSQITLDEAVKSYLFNSQLLSVNEDHMILIAPQECELMPRVKGYLDQLLSDSSQPIREVKFLDLHQSMRNGGGPACLRLRVVLSEKELRATHQKIMLTPKLYSRLVEWAKKNYRDKLDLKDLADFALVRESQKALDELTQILAFGSFYEFQK